MSSGFAAPPEQMGAIGVASLDMALGHGDACVKRIENRSPKRPGRDLHLWDRLRELAKTFEFQGREMLPGSFQ
ncbi:MAG: hypothetical protein OXE85_02590 [Roseovarius sp.]|nr:hypothetical protein [Roseovarius sp.]